MTLAGFKNVYVYGLVCIYSKAGARKWFIVVIIDCDYAMRAQCYYILCASPYALHNYGDDDTILPGGCRVSRFRVFGCTVFLFTPGQVIDVAQLGFQGLT